MNNNSTAIEINDLEMVYSDIFGKEKVRALDGISFSVNRGEIFGFLGPNGAGKTTTIHTLMNFIFPTRGNVRVFDLPVDDYRCRKSIGFLPELFTFDKFLRGKKLLEYLGMLSGVPSNIAVSKGEELLERLDMHDGFKRKIKTYSKGMTQKIGLVQAMLSDPDLLILDEPTSGMDPIAKSKVKKIFLDLKEQGKTVFLSTHILSDVQQIADRVAIINKGKLIKIDTLENLLKSPEETSVTFSLDNSILPEIENKWEIEKKEESVYVVSVLGKEGKAELIQKLAGLQADIISVTPRSMELEEIFMQLVDNGI